MQSDIDTLLSEIYFLREEINEKNQLIKGVFRNEDIKSCIAQNTFKKNDRNITNDKATEILVLNNQEKSKENLDPNGRSNTANINTVTSEISDSKSSPENIETRNPSNDCKINEQTDCSVITDKKSSFQENKRTKDIKKKNQKQTNDNAHTNNGNKIKKTVYILGDSMIKKLNGYLLTKKIKHKHLVKVRAFSGAKVSCMRDYANPTLRDINPEHIILHVGTNDLTSEKTASQISRSIIELGTSLKNDTNTVSISAIVPRSDKLDNKATEVNNRLVLMCQERNISFLSHSDIIDPSKHLNESKLHFNRQGMRVFAENISGFLTKLN